MGCQSARGTSLLGSEHMTGQLNLRCFFFMGQGAEAWWMEVTKTRSAMGTGRLGRGLAGAGSGNAVAPAAQRGAWPRGLTPSSGSTPTGHAQCGFPEVSWGPPHPGGAFEAPGSTQRRWDNTEDLVSPRLFPGLQLTSAPAQGPSHVWLLFWERSRGQGVPSVSTFDLTCFLIRI